MSALTYDELYRNTRNALRDNQIASPELEARLIVENASGKTRAEYIRDGALAAPTETTDKARRCTNRRLTGEPVAYITGEWEFYSLPFFVSRDTLIPRVDSEVLVGCAIELLRETDSSRVLDLCAGSGCLGIAVAKNVPDTFLTLADISHGALEVCEKNAKLNSVTAKSVFVNALDPPPDNSEYDVILCNPPYIPSGEIESLDRSVRDYEPISALDGGSDGLCFYRAVASKWKGALAYGGHMLFECGCGQARDVHDILKSEGFSELTSITDTAGIARVVTGRK